MAICEWLWIDGPDGIFELVPRPEGCISVFGGYGE